MFIPYASGRVVQRPPICVAAIVLCHFLVFVAVGAALALGQSDRAVALFAHFGLTPSSIRWHTPFTYFLLHEHVAHLTANMLALWVFGGPLEAAIGWRRLLALYLIAAAATGLAQAGLAGLHGAEAAQTPIVGASGAVAAVAGVFVVRFYRSRVRFVGLPWAIPAIALVGIGALADIVGAVCDAFGAQRGAVALTARWAHLGGFALGMVWAQLQRLHREGRDEYTLSDAVGGHPIAAAERLATACANRPEDADAHAQLARAWLAAGDPDRAADAFHMAMRLMLRGGRRANAIALLDEMRSSIPDAPLPASDQLALARAMEDIGQHAGAAEAYRRLVDRWRGTAEATVAAVRLGELLLRRLDRRDEAIEVLQRFLAENPGGDARSYAERLLHEAQAPV